MSASHLRRIQVIILILLTGPLTAQADVLLDKSTQLNLFGDVRYRYENDERIGATNTERTRSQIRARVGASFQPAPAWTGRLRLSTDATSPNSRDTTQSTNDTDKNGDFGLDQAYVAYTPAKIFNMYLGKTDFVFFQQNEVFWDNDISPESMAIVTQLGGLSLSATQMTLLEGEWEKDVTAEAYQMVYASGGITFAYGKAMIDRHSQFGRDTDGDATDDVFGFQSDEYTLISAVEKRGNWIFGIEYITSNSDSADTARILQFQHRIGNYGFRIYKYTVEAFSVMGDGMFSQNNFPVEGNTGVTNFKGYRLQFDFYTGENSSVDLSYYEMERIHDPASLGATASDAVMTLAEQKRMQLNFNVRF